MGHCTQCGDCCRAVRLRVDWELAAADLDHYQPSSDIQFVRDHFTEITPEDAERRLPGIVTLTGEEEGRQEHEHFYTCDQFNETTNLCMAHDSRPEFCRGFPFYGRDEVEEAMLRLYPRCGYWLTEEALQ